HQRERGGEAHHDRDHDEPQHGEAERGAAHGAFPPSSSRATERWRAASSIAFAESIATRRDSSSTYSLFESCVSITSISSTSARRRRGGEARPPCGGTPGSGRSRPAPAA